MIPLRHLGLLLLLFAVTVAIRWPNLGRPMSKHHEFCTATALRVLTVWHHDGIADKGFNPATNFPGAANKHINNHASGSGQMLDAQGNYYYVSHPPFCYYLPYAVFSMLHVEPDVLLLQLFHLFINLLCGFGIYLLAQRLLPERPFTGVLAALIYWFIPAVLWFQSNVYMSDMLVQPFFIAALLLALAILEKPSALLIIALGFTCFLGTYTTWFGILAAATIGFYFLWHTRRNAGSFVIVLVLILSQVLALALMTWQYSQIAGWDAYSAELVHRFWMRSHAEVGDNPGWFSLLILYNYASNYGLLLMLGLGAWLAQHKHPNIPRVSVFMFMGSVPIILMHVLLTNYTGHDFTTLYLAVLLSVGLALVVVSLQKKWLWTTMVLCVVSGPILYWLANPYGETSFNGNRYDAPLNEGLLLQAESPDAILFINGSSPSPEALWYAKRNVLPVSNDSTALEFMRLQGINKGIMFQRLRGGNIEKVKTLSL